MTLDTSAKRLGEREHYATHGKNAHIVARAKYKSVGSLGAGFPTKTTTVAFRHGREEDGQAVQMEITIDTRFDSGKTRSDSASVSLSPELWAAIVEHVKEDREIELPPYKRT